MKETSVLGFLFTGPWRSRARWALRLLTPWGIEWWLYTRPARRALREFEAEVVREAPPAHTRLEEATRFLLDQGLDEHAVREGSMPEDSLNYVAELVFDRLPADRPVRALHVGNFVGVSLCYFSWLVRERHPGSVVVSIDPNTAHRDIENPQAHVFALLHHFGLLDTNLIIPGYSLEQTVWGGRAESEADYRKGLVCENVLSSLERLYRHRFDLVLLDGNHEQSYLAREFSTLRGLLADNGMVVFDDVTEGRWDGVVRVFRAAIQDDGVVSLGEDGRVGVVQVSTARPAVVSAEL